ncbi:MAG: acetate--CoA ligase family protein [Bordetella sp.]|nr:acetate--CoA ligase family protein [Bordetella sp.]
MGSEFKPVSREAVGRLLRPRSVAVVGVSDAADSIGGRSLANLDAFGVREVHLVSRTNASVQGRACAASIDDLPDGIDAAVIALPQKAVVEALEACARKKIGGAVVYAAGFAEAGEEGARAQARMAAIAREADIAVLGPNTLGLTNYVDGVALAFGPNGPAKPGGRPAIAVLAQSGAMMGSLRLSAAARRYAVSYAVATGNEAVTGIEDYMAHVVDDPHTRAIAVFAEQLRRPLEFLKLAGQARRNGKPVILLHPGRSDAAQASAASHTGALSGDYLTMRAMVAAEGVIAVETLEEFLDTAEFLTRFPNPPLHGPAIITDSGALRGLSLDFAESHGLSIPALTAGTEARLKARLPAFAEAINPLDITAQGLKDMPLYAEATAALAEDEATGGVLVAAMPGSPQIGMAKADAVIPVLSASPKPKAYVVLGDAPVDPALPERLRVAGVPYFRAPERALRAFAHMGEYARLQRAAAEPRSPEPPAGSPIAGQGILVEHRGKALLRGAGLRTPHGRLAGSADEAAAIADGIGWPVVLKVQSAQLPHKTEVGGVAVNLTDEAALRAAYEAMAARVAEARPDAVIDGYLVEGMAPRGLELVVGGRRDPHWGPVLMVGLGGVWIEALKDVRLTPADMPVALIEAEIDQLRARVLLDGYRGAPPIDKKALAQAVASIGDLMRAHPEIAEIEVNPLVAYGAGEAPLALDALIVVDGSAA